MKGKNVKILTHPEPKQLKDLRDSVNFTPKQAGDLLHVNARTFQRWEKGSTRMPLAYWELFEVKIRVIRNRMVNGVMP
jgi:DNA-binding transcriptional regulator YiaG|tara:strand:- start:52 stop:285 length:234 start_codon:yes stop_codon:yes gene_type:complete